MLNFSNKNHKHHQFITLALLTLTCFGLSVFRYYYSNSKVFLFLNVNLFLASIPWILSSLFIVSKSLKNKNPFKVFILVSWIIFFPNAPYIFTDLFHLRNESNMPIWFDLILILSFAWTGILFGLYSLWDIERILKKNLNPKIVFSIVTVFLFIASFGVYLGRYLRWNSWDIITEPWIIISDILARIFNPFEHPRTWGMTLILGIFLNMVYWTFKFSSTNKKHI